MSDIEGLLQKVGPIWTPTLEPPELGTVPLDAGRMSGEELSSWLGKCSAWLSYAYSQLGLTEAQKSLVQRRFSRIVNELIVTKQVKQRTYELQVAEAMTGSKDLVVLQEEVTDLDAKIALWSRMVKAYETYLHLFFDERDVRKWRKD